ncbi:MAG: thiamine pyrophosphate-binding protein [Albidovulum sp.]|nr:thiamine pyrophosphate-binding protein [Albidovulum sp.]MDE0532382.1 thiamine pyrophosphate-binding protein [Albidovulum sp.]
MADGYAKASRNASVVLAVRNGPGATKQVTGLAQAKAPFSPLVFWLELFLPSTCIEMHSWKWTSRHSLLPLRSKHSLQRERIDFRNPKIRRLDLPRHRAKDRFTSTVRKIFWRHPPLRNRFQV